MKNTCVFSTILPSYLIIWKFQNKTSKRKRIKVCSEKSSPNSLFPALLLQCEKGIGQKERMKREDSQTLTLARSLLDDPWRPALLSFLKWKLRGNKATWVTVYFPPYSWAVITIRKKRFCVHLATIYLTAQKAPLKDSHKGFSSFCC